MPCRVFVERHTDVLMFTGVHMCEQFQHIFITPAHVEFVIRRPLPAAIGFRLPAKNGAQQNCDRNLAFAINLDRNHVTFVCLELEPCAAARD